MNLTSFLRNRSQRNFFITFYLFSTAQVLLKLIENAIVASEYDFHDPDFLSGNDKN